MSPTKVTSIRIDEQLLNQAKELGLNLSQICSQAIQIVCNTPVIQNGNPHSLNNPETIKTMLKQRVGSLARTGHEPPKLGVAGSNPVPPARFRGKKLEFLGTIAHLPTSFYSCTS